MPSTIAILYIPPDLEITLVLDIRNSAYMSVTKIINNKGQYSRLVIEIEKKPSLVLSRDKLFTNPNLKCNSILQVPRVKRLKKFSRENNFQFACHEITELWTRI